MLAAASKPSAAGSPLDRPLTLESGEFLHSREFLRRYEYMPQAKKAELIEGVVSMGSPLSVRYAKPDNQYLNYGRIRRMESQRGNPQ
jgi:hypothetical protein